MYAPTSSSSALTVAKLSSASTILAASLDTSVPVMPLWSASCQQAADEGKLLWWQARVSSYTKQPVRSPVP
jgi:hypothetical protein